MKLETLNKRGLSSIEFELKWNSSHAKHTDYYFARKVNLWRDLFPQKIVNILNEKEEGDSVTFSQKHDEIIPPYDPSYEFDIEKWQFDHRYFHPYIIEPRFGRFYPKGILKGVQGVFKGNVEPFRCVGIEGSRIIADFNHLLSEKDILLTISIKNIREKSGEIGGMCIDWIDIVTDGPGIQARYNGNPTDFFSDGPFSRSNESDDAIFYKNPRFVTHIDDMAISVMSKIYGNLLSDGIKVLDLMSSWKSHIPANKKLASLIGLGLNEEEMSQNSQLDGYVVHDLNKNLHIPFKKEEFDAVICTVSIEYLIYPFEIFEDIARILKPGGIFIITFSNRWFPPKVVNIWTHLHEFERMGLVMEYFLHSRRYSNLETFSLRGLPRTENDRHFPEINTSDPVYAVWGKRY